jgi:hypothetical protein
LGDRCEQLSYEVYAVRADYAQTLRLVLIDGTGPLPESAEMAPPAAGFGPGDGPLGDPAPGRAGFRPLRHKLLARQRGEASL